MPSLDVIRALRFCCVLLLTSRAFAARSSNITANVFGPSANSGYVAAFGDFNSDELTDVFMLQNDAHKLQLLYGFNEEPLLRPGPSCSFAHLTITGVVPGDFDGDANMDVLVTVQAASGGNLRDVYVHWGDSETLNCTDPTLVSPLISGMRGEPLALDYNRDMIIDLFGLDADGQRTFWVFGDVQQRAPLVRRLPDAPDGRRPLKVPHAHAYLDLNGDFTADLFLTTETDFEVWHGRTPHGPAANETLPFEFGQRFDPPEASADGHIGQSLFLDVQLTGQLDHLLPVCFDKACANSTLMLMHANGTYTNLQLNLKDHDNVQWGLVKPRAQHAYLSASTLRGGDFNMDGYPDLLVTLERVETPGWLWQTQPASRPQTFLLENVPCEQRNCGAMQRTFAVRWHDLDPFGVDTTAGAFYDFYQDGILDVLFVRDTLPSSNQLQAFRNLLDYDANFVKCIVLTGRTNRREPTRVTPLGRKKRTYGTNLPGPRIEYFTTTQDGEPQRGTSTQIPQSAYFSLQLPYTIFGLGRTPNFVDKLTVGLGNESRTWKQLIPNSQMIVVPDPIDAPSVWKMQLFVTPGKLIVKSVIALGGTCLLIMLIILALYIKEKREDRVEQQQEALRFPFDAM